MSWSRGRWVALCSVLFLMSSPAAAGPNDPALCAVNNIGVPGLGNRPTDWFFPTSGAPPAASPDDPKWKGSAGHSLTNGGATAPAELRVNWQPNAGTGQPEYVYLSWEFFVATTTAWATDHVLYLGFKN